MSYPHFHFSSLFLSELWPFTSPDAFNGLFHLAARFSEHAPELRAEVEEMVAKEGWTKSSASKMFKPDSFLRETTCFSGFRTFVSSVYLLLFISSYLIDVPPVTLHRKVMNRARFTFSDGVTVTHGYYFSALSYTVHNLAKNSENPGIPDVFDEFRFYKLRTAREEPVSEDIS